MTYSEVKVTELCHNDRIALIDAGRLGEFLRQRGKFNGFMFQTFKGKQSKVGGYKEEFLDRLVWVCARK
jgi:hypothetical protein